MSEYLTSRIRCPVCSTDFVVEERHGVEPVARDTDFRPVFSGADPLFSLVHACPGCNYASYRAGFDGEPPDQDDLLDPFVHDPRALPCPVLRPPGASDADDLLRYSRAGELGDGLLGPGRVPFGRVRYLLAARVHDFLWDDDAPGVSHFLLRAAWCARSEGALLDERTAMLEVVSRLEKWLGTSAGADHERLRATYLVAELSRRVGDFARAIDAFAQVEHDAPADEEEGLLYAMLARRQTLLAQVKSDVNARIPDEWPSRGFPPSSDDPADDPLLADDDDGDGGPLN